METLEKKLGYTFQDKSLLENALTHSSCANESKGRLQSNERLEFLGDSILGMVVADHLYRNHPDLPEGDLTRTRAALVCEESLVVVAEELGLGEYLHLGRGEEAGGGRQRPSIRADAVEAVLAAFDEEAGGKPRSGYVANIQGALAVSANKRGVRIEPMSAYRARRKRG